MDNKIILELIKKDLEEIRILVDALELSNSNEQLLIDITASKAKTLLDEISLLKTNVKNELLSDEISVEKVAEDTVVEKTLKIENIIEEPVATEPEITQTPLTESKIEPVITESIAVEEKTNDIIEKVAEKITIEKELPIENKIIEPTETEEPVINEEKTAPTLEKTIEESKANESKANESKILGENFIKEPSLNERFASINDKKSKIVGKPVTSIKGAIGLNDKFMYMRELFENDAEKMNSTIETIDKANGIVEAVEFLEQNFKWQKNDVSLKFIELVKKRFDF